MDKMQILKVVVGSQAHGLATAKSDIDYRGVFVIPTSEMLKLGNKVHFTSWNEGSDDDTSWELGHFLNLAIHCNPTILETFLAPLDERSPITNYGKELRELFPSVWNSTDAKDAFIGYGINQRKKFLENKDNRRAKYACAYLRVLYNATELLENGIFSVDMSNTPIFETLKKWRNDEFEMGEVVQISEEWKEKIEKIYSEKPKKEADLKKINNFLLKVRRECWV
ncbi:MAG: nucleotidyltransferase domain-containing protein [Candidatus Levyibacteriota bacterium]